MRSTFFSSVFLRILFSSFLFLQIFSTNYLNAQTNPAEGCITVPGPYAVGELPAFAGPEPALDYHLRLYVYILRPSNGIGGMTVEQVEQSLAILDDDFNEHGIYFVRGCPIIVKDDGLYNNGKGNACRLFFGTDHPYRNADGINLYFGSTFHSPASNVASGYVGNCALVYGKINDVPSAFSGLVSHEVGHCLGLWHTFNNATSSNAGLPECPLAPPGIPVQSCPELVDGSNSADCGDFVTHDPLLPELGTPADPGVGWTVNHPGCVWTGTTVDSEGDPYDPDESNIMSYSHPLCMTRFAPRQGLRMRTLIASEQILQNCITNPNTSSGVTVTQSTVWSLGNVPNGGYIGSLLIKSGASLTVQSGVTLYFDEVGSAFIEPNAAMILNGTLTNGPCSEKWKGVIVKGNSNASQKVQNGVRAQGYFQARPGSLIENAEIGVRLYDPATALSTGGQIYCEGTTFKNNRVGVKFASYIHKNTNGAELSYAGRFTNCHFLNDVTYHVALGKFYAFIEMESVNDVNILGCKFNNLQNIDDEQIELWGYGIKATDASFKVLPFCNNFSIPCNSYTYSLFENLGYGVHAQFAAKTRPFTVTGATFDKCYIGIFDLAIDFPVITFNQFKMNKVPNPFVSTQIGLLFNTDVEGFTVEENWFGRSYEGNNGLKRTIGSACYNIGSTYNYIRRNTYDRLSIGNLANRRNAKNDGISPKGLIYNCNTNNNVVDMVTPGLHDFAVTADAVIYKYQEGPASFLFHQAAGNQFSYADDDSDSDFLNAGLENINYYFVQQGQQRPLDYTAATLTPITQDVPPNTCEQQVCYPFCDPPFEQSRNNFNYHRQQWLDLKQQPPSPTVESGLQYHRQGMDKFGYQMIRFMLADSVDFSQDSLMLLLANIEDYAADRWRAREYYQSGQVATGAQILNDAPVKYSLNTTEITDLANYKTILDIVSSQPSVHDLSNTAQQQVLSYTNAGGIAEGMARGIMGIYGYYYDPHYELPDDPEERGESTLINRQNSLTISPNPADKYLTINNIPVDAIKITISDAGGKVIKELTSQNVQNDVYISTVDYPNGVYFFMITTRSGTAETGKFIVQH